MSGIKQAMAVVVARLETILQTNGYNTDLGKYVRVNADSQDAKKLPAVTVFSGEGEMVSRTRTQMRFSREILIEAILRVCPDDTNLDIEDALLDVHQALLSPECKCGSPTEYLDGNVVSLNLAKYSVTERKDGCKVQGLALQLNVEYIVWCCQHSNN